VDVAFSGAMEIVESSRRRLVLRSERIIAVLGLSGAAGCVLFAILLAFVGARGDRPSTFLASVVLLGLGLLSFFLTRPSYLEIDTTAGVIRLWSGRKCDSWSLADVQDLVVDSSTDDEGQTTDTVRMVLSSGDKISLPVHPEMIDLIRDYLPEANV
jgi:hypothetical protein